VLKIARTEHRCGGAGSVVASITALGVKAYCLGIIGYDREGEILKTMLAKIGADVSNLPTTVNHHTINKQRSIGLAQSMHRQQLIRMDRECTEPLNDELNEKIFDELTPLSLIRKVRPDVFVKGEDWAERGVLDREFVESYNGKVALAPLVTGRSSTATIEKM
jgi:bifunctional ADP-heptose synthase (sugar kinase/adenylyltransferase)